MVYENKNIFMKENARIEAFSDGVFAIAITLLSGIVFLCSCSVIEKSSQHGFESGYYSFKSNNHKVEKVYLDITNEKITVFPERDNTLNDKEILDITLLNCDTLSFFPKKFTKKSLDIDITTILCKYRPGVEGQPAQLTADFNAAIYAGWRHDNYIIKSKMDPMKKYHNEVVNRGYDFGFFVGPGTTLISPFSTNNAYSNEYNGMILQFGLAGFIESNVASFGISTGFDYLLSPERKVWIYNHKPWIGFIVGIALN
jgi:hypothetical protein